MSSTDSIPVIYQLLPISLPYIDLIKYLSDFIVINTHTYDYRLEGLHNPKTTYTYSLPVRVLRSTGSSRDVQTDPDGRSSPDQVARRGTTPSETREVAVSVSGLTKRFGDRAEAITAVDTVTFDVERGSIVGLLGPNGAGKTTLIKSILGMVLPDDGSVRIRGVDVHDDPRRAYASVDAMLEGARNDYWRLTVRENLRYFATVSGVDPDSVVDRHERLLEQLELTEKADVAVRDLSRGMKQKVSLASVLTGGAEVVFLDEQTLGLDIESS